MAAHPNVTINLTVLENEAFKAKLATDMQAGNAARPVPVMGRRRAWPSRSRPAWSATSTTRSPCKDTMNPARYEHVPGRTASSTASRTTSGIVGFWYNKDLFAEAGITAPPATWDEFLDAVGKLKDAGITPIAVGGKDKWPAMFWWAYLALRSGRQQAMKSAVATGDWTGAAFVQAGTELKKLIDLEPFQEGFLGPATYPRAGRDGRQRQGRHGADGPVGPRRREGQQRDREGIGDALGWFPFPSLEGGAGAADRRVRRRATASRSGKDAPPEAVDFLKFFVTQHGRRPTLRAPQRRHPADDQRRRRARHRSEPDAGAREARRVELRAALSRPGDHAGAGWRHQRRDPGRSSRAR